VASAVAGEFKQSITTGLDRAGLGGAQQVGSGADAAFRSWAIYSLSRDEALKEISAAVNAAKEKVAAGNFNLGDFDSKFANAAAKEWK
jgi:hypothetical protein